MVLCNSFIVRDCVAFQIIIFFVKISIVFKFAKMLELT